jgi:hypothetical protein
MCGIQQTAEECDGAGAARWTRITSEEEERVREGYCTGGGAIRERRTLIEPPTGRTILSALYLPQAELWRINHGWRKSSEQLGFIIDSATGRWRSRDDVDDTNDGNHGGGTLVTGIRPFTAIFTFDGQKVHDLWVLGDICGLVGRMKGGHSGEGGIRRFLSGVPNMIGTRH